MPQPPDRFDPFHIARSDIRSLADLSSDKLSTASSILKTALASPRCDRLLGRNLLQAFENAYKVRIKPILPSAESFTVPPAHRAPTDMSANAGWQCQGDFHASASHRPGRFTRSPHCNVAGLLAGGCVLFKSE